MEDIKQSVFKTTHKDCGTLKQGQNIDFRFDKVDDNIEIANIVPSCGCFNPVYNKEMKSILVSYKVKNIPEHLKSQGYFIDSKQITVTLDNGDKEVLTFSIKVIK